MSKYEMSFLLEGKLEWEADSPREAVRESAAYLNDRLQTIKRYFVRQGGDFSYDLKVPYQAARIKEE